LKNQKERQDQWSYKTKFSTKKNSGKFAVLTKARIKLLNGDLSQESYDLFISCMKQKDDEL
jgi:hypothetical protein